MPEITPAQKMSFIETAWMQMTTHGCCQRATERQIPRYMLEILLDPSFFAFWQQLQRIVSEQGVDRRKRGPEGSRGEKWPPHLQTVASGLQEARDSV
jgi:hypothetical protein